MKPVSRRTYLLATRRTMAYDEDLANRIRELIASEDGYTEQKMFGGIGFMIDGHLAVGSAARVA